MEQAALEVEELKLKVVEVVLEEQGVHSQLLVEVAMNQVKEELEKELQYLVQVG